LIKLIKWLPFLVAVGGCSGNFESYSVVTGLRLLGAKSEPAEIAPGDTATLTAFVVDPQSSAFQIDWAACTEPPIPGTGQVNTDCVTVDSAPYLTELGNGLTVTAQTPVFDPTTIGDPDATGGRYLPIRLKVSASDGNLTGILSLRISSDQALNHNPKIADITADGASLPLDGAAPLEVHAGQILTLRASVTPDSTEQYQALATDGTTQTRTEQIAISWFTTFGSWQDDSTGTDTDDPLTIAAPLPQTGQSIDLWIVARDERGGSDFAHRTLLFR
jgi:hypothetical protein